MTTLSRIRRWTAIMLPVAFAVPSHAQTALYVEHGKEFCLVRRVDDQVPMIDDGAGKLIRASTRNYALRQVPEYAPIYVAIRNLNVATEATRIVESGTELNHRLEFRAEFESPSTLNNVYIVLDLNSDEAGKALLLQEIGRLTARTPKSVRIAGSLSRPLREGKYQVHLYSDGTELLHTQMPLLTVEHILDGMVRRRIANVTDADPRPFTGPAPEYPARFRRDKVRGEAVIGFKISANGRVLDPEVKSASDPAFGESALAVSRLWRFLPMVKNGVATPTLAEMPFVFEPSPSSPAKPAP